MILNVNTWSFQEWFIFHTLQNTVLCIVKRIEESSDVCKEHNVPLFMDGARLGYGLMSDQSDLTFEDIAKYCDIFYIGGTKIGALCGEAIVFTKNNAKTLYHSNQTTWCFTC